MDSHARIAPRRPPPSWRSRSSPPSLLPGVWAPARGSLPTTTANVDGACSAAWRTGRAASGLRSRSRPPPGPCGSPSRDDDGDPPGADRRFRGLQPRARGRVVARARSARGRGCCRALPPARCASRSSCARRCCGSARRSCRPPRPPSRSPSATTRICGSPASSGRTGRSRYRRARTSTSTRGLPTGVCEALDAERAPLGERSFDDLFAVGAGFVRRGSPAAGASSPSSSARAIPMRRCSRPPPRSSSASSR